MKIVLTAISAGYSRAHESEADSLAVIYMTRRGESYEGAVDLLNSLDSGTRTCLLWASHPEISDRITLITRVGQKRKTEIDKIRQQMNVGGSSWEVGLAEDAKAIQDCILIHQDALATGNYAELEPFLYLSGSEDYLRARRAIERFHSDCSLDDWRIDRIAIDETHARVDLELSISNRTSEEEWKRQFEVQLSSQDGRWRIVGY